MDVVLSDYAARIERLFARTGARINPGLERTRALLEEIGDPQHGLHAFHVAGTNGKGSTCATIEALLAHGGRRVGRYSSPHLVDFRERIVVGGVPVEESEVVRWLDRLEPVAERVGATFFEITTALAFAHFAAARVDAAVIETGMGGAMDATNVVDPLVAAVTNVGLDHTEYLGPTLQDIADEKGGIFKFGRPAVIGEPRADLARRLADRAAERGASQIVITRNDWRPWSIEVRGSGTAFVAQTPRGRLRVATPLVGEHQAHNTVTAIAAVDAAGWLPKLGELNHALAAARLPGRFQQRGEWIFDVAHNPAGARVLVRTIEALPIRRPLHAIVGVLRDKDWRGIIDELSPVVDSFIITQPETAPAERAWDPLEAGVYAHSRKVPTLLDASFETALLRAGAMPGTKLVTGSFHTVGDAMRRLGVDPLGGHDSGNTV